MLVCSKCGETKGEDQFYINRRDSRGYSYNCKPCELSAKKAEYQRNKGARLEYRRKYLYGLSEQEYQSLIDRSGGLCEICREPCKSGRALAVDHCHDTSVVRGLLCTRCNNAIGNFKDSVELLRSAINYLERGPNV